MKTILRNCLILFSSLIVSCHKTSSDNPTNTVTDPDVNTLVQMNAPAGFNFGTSKEIQLDITLLSSNDQPLNAIMVNILDQPEEQGGKILYTAFTNNAGKILGSFKLPDNYSSVIVDPGFVGVMRNAVVTVANQSISCVLGGKSGYSGNVVPAAYKPVSQTLPSAARIQSVISYLSAYNTQGKPTNLLSTNDIVSPELLSFINASLPEQKQVPVFHPDYLKNTAEMNLHITELSDVWITFVHEGAGYRNSVAFFTYPTATPPQTKADIDTLRVILPNASLAGSGGELVSGNKVLLGRFEPGTSIGFALITNGWTGSLVSPSASIVYSIDALNSETALSDKRHAILLNDAIHQLILIGFEDMNRNPSTGSDNDFNDCLIYATSNPVTAINTSNMNPIDQPIDRDNDGVSDVYDKFPDDPTRAYINYFPSATSYGTLAFEDNWPYMGDYDFNDLVVKYRYEIINNAANKTVDLQANYVVVAAGAKMKNGFAVEFPFAASTVKSLTGSKMTSGFTTVDANGCETGSSKAIFVAFENAFTVMNTNGMFNTFMAQSFITPDTIHMKINFTTPLTAAELGVAPFNPFLIVNQTRGREVHLAGYMPTAKANTALLGTGHDNTKPAQNIYYKTASNLPFALGFVEEFNYPVEMKAVHLGYTTFIDWAKSGATKNTDWYKNAQSSVSNYIYKK